MCQNADYILTKVICAHGIEILYNVLNGGITEIVIHKTGGLIMKIRIPRRLKKVVKNFLKHNPRAVYYTTKHHKAYTFGLYNGRLSFIVYYD